MKHSNFYKKRIAKDEVVISFLFMEVLHEVMSGNPDIQMAELLSTTHEKVFAKAPTEAQIEAIAKVLSEHEKNSVLQDDQKPAEVGRTMGSDLMKWLAELNSTQICYVVAGYDPARAEELYCDTDFRVVSEMCQLYISDQWQRLQSVYEASMYGFGGKYSDDKSASDAEVIDLSEGATNQGLNELTKLGF